MRSGYYDHGAPGDPCNIPGMTDWSKQTLAVKAQNRREALYASALNSLEQEEEAAKLDQCMPVTICADCRRTRREHIGRECPGDKWVAFPEEPDAQADGYKGPNFD